MNQFMIILLVGLLSLVAIVFVTILFLNAEKEKKQRRLSIITGKKQSFADKSNSDAQNRRRDAIAKKLKERQDEEKKGSNKDNLTSNIRQAGLEISPKQFWIYSAGSGLMFMIVSKIIFGMGAFGIVAFAIIGFFGFPRFILNKLIARRQKKFLEEFPDVLEAMVRLLKSGMPVTEAIAMAGREYSGPVGDEMMRIYEAQKIGVSMPDAALEASRRMPITEMQMFATGIAIQVQTGASLSDVLMNLSGVIRARFKLKRKVKALSSEAKSSAAIIGALPFLIGGGLYLIRPDYIGVLFTTTTGKVIMTGSAIWMCMGIFVMKIMINFKI